uniref:Pseudouridine-5'-monophosphatase n=1 Tax=Mesocestoides corti TaxID=53468 RepID=A0A5K3FJR4_MESCO
MRQSPQVTHVLFDLDGLLINSEEIYTDVYSNFLLKYGKQFTYHAKTLMMGRKTLEAVTALKDFYELPMSATEIIEELKSNFPPEIWRKAELMPGAKKLVDHLYSNSVPMAIATGSFSSQIKDKTWNIGDVMKCISHVVAGGDDPEVKRGKPAPDIFLVALRRFNDPSARPETTLVFEDSWNGVRAAVAAGMYVVWVPDPAEAPGFPDDNGLTDEAKSRILRLTSLECFDPADYGLPPY